MTQLSGNNYDNNLYLIEKAQSGDEEALNEVVKNNLPLVSAICKKFLNRGYEFEDLFQIGSMGLIKAIKNFDLSFNVKFSTYAVPMIMGEIKRFLRDDGMIKVSRDLKNTAKKFYNHREVLYQKLNREPTLEEISEYSGISKEDLILAMDAVSNIQYLYDVVHQEDGNPIYLIDKIEDENKEKEVVDNIVLKETINSLDKRSRQIIILRYFKDKTQTEVSKLLGISQVQVSRIEKKVLKIMKEKLKPQDRNM